ncbi:MAG TPA: BON domain-containing protein, partial [Gemmatimonadaceae bacterium]
MSTEATIRHDLASSPPNEAAHGIDMLSLLAAIGVGATAMYLLDPARGRRRRHVVADRFVHAGHVAGDRAATTTRDLEHHARGLASSVRRRFGTDVADDVVLAERVRAELGRAVSHPGAIETTVRDGTVTLTGPVLAHEADALLAAIDHVRGVAAVEDRLDRHETPGTVPALQGSSTIPASTFEFLQDNWTPAARLMATL